MPDKDDLELYTMAWIGLISTMPDERKAKIKECAAKLEEMVAEYGGEGVIALIGLTADKTPELKNIAF